MQNLSKNIFIHYLIFLSIKSAHLGYFLADFERFLPSYSLNNLYLHNSWLFKILLHLCGPHNLLKIWEYLRSSRLKYAFGDNHSPLNASISFEPTHGYKSRALHLLQVKLGLKTTLLLIINDLKFAIL